jgi:hypothetical protein
MADKMETDHHVRYMSELIQAKNMPALAGNIAHELWRIANAQEEMLQMAKADLEAQVEEAIKSRSEERAAELVADKNKRSFIGKKS